MMTTIVTLRKTTREALSIVGQKAVNLGILAQKFPVPPAFILTAAAFQSFLDHTGIAKKAEQLLAAANTPEKVMQAAKTIQHLILNTSLPEDFTEELLDAYYSLNIEEQHSLNDLMEQGEEPFVAVRPSPVGYDGTGLHQSFLNVKGMPELEKALQECWASFYSQEAIEYRQQQQASKMQFAIIIQKMIDSHAAGIMETSYKMNREEVLILGCKGFGTALATGQVVPDKYFITKKTLNIALIEPGKQPFFFERDMDTNKTTKVYLQDEYSKKQKLTDRHIGELTLYAKKIEEIFGKPQNVDFAIWKEKIYFLGTAEPEWWSEQLQKEQEQKMQKLIVPEPTAEELEKKEEEISVHLTKELEEDVLIARAVTGVPENMHSVVMQQEQEEEPEQEQMIAEEKQRFVEPEMPKEQKASVKSADSHDINSIIQGIDFTAMLTEAEQQTVVSKGVQQSAASLVFPEQQKTEAITEEVAETAAEPAEEEAEIETVTEVSRKELTQFEKAAGNLVVHCFKEVKGKVPKEQWSTSPVLRHLAVLAQNFSQKNVAPTSAQVKFALDAVEKMEE